jgi:filamentous hemagglutinin family protein
MKRKAIAVAVAATFSHASWAGINDGGNVANLPTGGVASGTGSVTNPVLTSNSLSVDVSGRSIINWSTFNIGAGNTVTFNGPGAAVLNKVPLGSVPGATTPTPNSSTIAGTLSAPGVMVMLMNPNGVLFTSSAVVNVGSLVATTGRIDDAEFLGNGKAVITYPDGYPRAAIINQGSITVDAAGLAALVAPSITNEKTIVATGGKIVLAGTDTATINLNGLYELAVTGGAGSVTNAAGASLNGATIVLTAGAAGELLSRTVNLHGVQEATDAIVVDGGKVVLTSDLKVTGTGVPGISGHSDLVEVRQGAQIQDAVAIAKSSGATLQVVGGQYSGEVSLGKANMTVSGSSDATLSVAAGERGFNIAANGVTVEGMKIVGPYDQPYTTVDWNAVSTTTAGVTLQPGFNNAVIRSNDIRNVRTGVQILGTTTGSSVTGNTIDNTKGSILLRSAGVAVSGNRLDALGHGNEWDVVLLNNIADGAYFTSPHASQASYGADMMAMSADNGGMHILDRRYGSNGLLGSTPQFGNRSHIVVSAGSSFTAADDFNLGNGLGNARQPLGFISAGINAVVAGGRVSVAAGTYAESLSISKALTLAGAGKGLTIIDPAGGNATGILVSGNIGSDASVIIRDLTVQGGGNGIQVADGTTLGTITLDGLAVRDNASQGFISNNGGSNATTVANINILNSVFAGNGVGPGSADINLFRFNGNALIRNVDILGTRGSASNLAAATDYGLQIRGQGEVSNMTAAGNVQLENVRIAGNYRRAHLGIQRYSDASNIVMSGVQLGGKLESIAMGNGATASVAASKAGFGTFFSSEQKGALSLGDTVFLAADNPLDINLGNATASMRVNAAGVAFKDADGDVRTDNFAIEDRVAHGIDGTDSGLVTWNPGHLYVTAATPGGGIQRAINLACACDTVHVGAGTFAEQLNVSKSLILLGAGSDQTIIRPTALAADNLGMKSILTISGAGTNAEVSGFKFMGPVPEINAGIFVRDGAHAHVHDNKLVDIRESVALSGVQRGIGIFVGRASLGTSGSALIERNTITGYQKGGIVVDGPGSQATILGNTVTGEGPTAATAQNGIQASRGASAHIEGNTVRGNSYTPDSDDATGILIFTPGANLAQGEITVGPNDVRDNEVGIWTNDPRSLTRISLNGIAGNGRNAVADFAGGYAGQANLEYPAWARPNAALVSIAGFGGNASGDIVDVGGSLRVAGYNAFAAIQAAVDAVASGARIDVAAGAYAENVTVGGPRDLYFNDVTLGSLKIRSDSGIGGRATANGADGFQFQAKTFLLGDTSLTTTGANIAFNGDIQGRHALSLNAGSGNVSLVSGGSEADPLGRLEVDANNFTLLGTLWVSGYDIDALGAVALSNHSLHSVGGGGTDAISAGGDVTGTTTSTSAVQIQSAGSVAANVTSQGGVAVEGSSISGNYTSTQAISFVAQEVVNVNVQTPVSVDIKSNGPANVSGQAPSIVVEAPTGSVSGDFGQVVNAGGGLIEVNGKPQVNTTIAETASNNRVVPQEVTTGASRDAGGRPTVTRRRRKPEDALDMLENGESIELDLTPG